MQDAKGILGALDAPLHIYLIVISFFVLAFYNSLELQVILWMTFRRYKGLYFISLLVSSGGILLVSIVSMLKMFGIWRNPMVSLVFQGIGWVAMVTGQAFVLYSRLHLVVASQRVLRGVLYMIIINAILFHTPIIVIGFLANTASLAAKYVPINNSMENVEVIAFSIQESIISGIYLYETQKILKLIGGFAMERAQQIMWRLIYANVLIVILDVAIITAQCTNNYMIQVTFKDFAYSLKLKLEFIILNQVKEVASSLAYPATPMFSGDISTSYQRASV